MARQGWTEDSYFRWNQSQRDDGRQEAALQWLDKSIERNKERRQQELQERTQPAQEFNCGGGAAESAIRHAVAQVPRRAACEESRRRRVERFYA